MYKEWGYSLLLGSIPRYCGLGQRVELQKSDIVILNLLKGYFFYASRTIPLISSKARGRINNHLVCFQSTMMPMPWPT